MGQRRATSPRRVVGTVGAGPRPPLTPCTVGSDGLAHRAVPVSRSCRALALRSNRTDSHLPSRAVRNRSTDACLLRVRSSQRTVLATLVPIATAARCAMRSRLQILSKLLRRNPCHQSTNVDREIQAAPRADGSAASKLSRDESVASDRPAPDPRSGPSSAPGRRVEVPGRLDPVGPDGVLIDEVVPAVREVDPFRHRPVDREPDRRVDGGRATLA